MMSNFMFCATLVILSFSKSGRSSAANVSRFSGVNDTYHASCGRTASERPTMRSLKMSNPVVSVSKHISFSADSSPTSRASSSASVTRR